MQKYKQVAINIAFLTLILTGGVSDNYINSSDSDDYLNDFKQAQQERFLTTFENNDYAAYLKLINKRSELKEIVNEQIFKVFVEARLAARSGKYDEAINLSNKLEKELQNKIGSNYTV